MTHPIEANPHTPVAIPLDIPSWLAARLEQQKHTVAVRSIVNALGISGDYAGIYSLHRSSNDSVVLANTSGWLIAETLKDQQAGTTTSRIKVTEGMTPKLLINRVVSPLVLKKLADPEAAQMFLREFLVDGPQSLKQLTNRGLITLGDEFAIVKRLGKKLFPNAPDAEVTGYFNGIFVYLESMLHRKFEEGKIEEIVDFWFDTPLAYFRIHDTKRLVETLHDMQDNKRARAIVRRTFTEIEQGNYNEELRHHLRTDLISSAARIADSETLRKLLNKFDIDKRHRLYQDIGLSENEFIDLLIKARRFSPDLPHHLVGAQVDWLLEGGYHDRLSFEDLKGSISQTRTYTRLLAHRIDSYGLEGIAYPEDANLLLNNYSILKHLVLYYAQLGNSDDYQKWFALFRLRTVKQESESLHRRISKMIQDGKQEQLIATLGEVGAEAADM